MRLKFFSHLILMVLLNLIVKPIAIFGIDANVQNVVGASEYGIYFSLLNFSYLFNILLDVGITNFNTKYIAQYPHLAKQYIGKIIPLRFLLLLFYIGITLTFAFLFSYNSEQFKLVYYLILNQFLISVILYFRSYFSGLLMLKTDIVLSVLDKFLLIFVMGYMLFFQTKIQISVLLFVQVQSFTLALTTIISLLLIISRIGLPKLKWNIKFNYLIIKKSFPYALLIILMMLYNRIDSVMLERILPYNSVETGIYAQAFRLLDAFFMFATLFSTLLFPIFSRMLRKKENVMDLLYSSSSVLISGAILLIIICYFNSEFLMDLIYKQEISKSSFVFKYLIISFLPISIILIFGTLLTSNGNMKFLNIISFVGIFLNVIFNWVLIPEYGAFGATISSLVTQSMLAIVYLVFTFYSFKISFSFTIFLKYLGFVATCIISAILLQQLNSDVSKILLLAFIGLTFLLASNMLQWKLVFELIKKKKMN